jgi:hypothetical protein
LQARGEVRRLTNDGLLRLGFINPNIAHNNKAGRNADANLQRDACPYRKPKTADWRSRIG